MVKWNEADALKGHKPVELAFVCQACGRVWPCPTIVNWNARKPKSKR